MRGELGYQDESPQLGPSWGPRDPSQVNGPDEGCGVGERRTMQASAAQAHHTPSTKAHSAGTHSEGTHSRCTQREHGKRKRAQRKHAEQAHAQQVHATRAWEALARTTQACTAQAQSTGRRTPAMSTTLTSKVRTI